jgi:uncharacterized protein (TIGR02118 family)
VIKSVVLFRCRPGMQIADFAHHWEHRHAPLVARLPGLRRYVQSQTLASAYAKFTPACDGVAELWFDDSRALREAAATPQYATTRADEHNFVIEPLDFVITREREIALPGGC